jgi:hypothetical protein
MPDRTFFTATRGDGGKRLGYLILANEGTEHLYELDWAWLKQFAGVIVRAGEFDEFLAYDNEIELVRAWQGLHAIAGLRMNAEAEAEFDERLDELDDEPENETNSIRLGFVLHSPLFPPFVTLTDYLRTVLPTHILGYTSPRKHHEPVG